ncbi:MAG: methionyl-tRNA formyltransferase [Alphaproteobacteria bacterium]|jgi:methionyl-tRNA formyltransferase|nr:methionyl-tRNA formyltransferase [Alphaproteobacteria bacterium]MDF3034703.1 methionyl-tRNA formyltransferase [Alphaproteobacteria bacterium]
MDTPPLRLIFMGTPAFSVPTLQALLDSRHHVVAVYSQPPRPGGRGYQVQRSAVHQRAATEGIPVLTPLHFKNEEDQALFASHHADLAIVVAYGLILPEIILEAPRLGCLNVHASLLPRWRGAAPIQRAIEAGDQDTGLTIMKMDAGLDTGPMLLKKSIPLRADTTAKDLHDALSAMGGDLLLEALEGYTTGALHPLPQPIEGVTYAGKLKREEGQIHWRSSAVGWVRKIQAFTPWPGVWFEHEGVRLKVLAAEAITHITGEPGTVLDDQLTIACGEGALRIKILQRPGGTALDAATFLRGYSLPVGSILPCPAIS